MRIRILTGFGRDFMNEVRKKLRKLSRMSLVVRSSSSLSAHGGVRGTKDVVCLSSEIAKVSNELPAVWEGKTDKIYVFHALVACSDLRFIFR
ncbi:hypothetical protein AGMMS49593_08690 [Endomicrobiia bacterium]|nr:hypothetical protein AGMMS49593_08690 [Endomicrobiia bacterium]